MRNLFLHIGHAKTATSSLQTFMLLNDAQFAAQGIWVPGDYRAFGLHDCKAVAQSGRSFSGNFAPLFSAHVAKTMDVFSALMDHVTSRDTDVLLSTELVFYYKYMVRDILRAANERGFAVTLIAYLRRQDRMVVPTYYQNISNHGYHASLDSFLAETADVRYFRYHEVMTAYAVSAPNRLVVRTFEPEFLAGGDIIEDFTTLLGVDISRPPAGRPLERANQSLPLETLEILRALNALKRPDLVKQILARPGTAQPGGSRQAWRQYYDAGIAATVAEHFMAGNAGLVADHLQDRGEAERAYWAAPPDLPERASQLDADGMGAALRAILPAA